MSKTEDVSPVMALIAEKSYKQLKAFKSTISSTGWKVWDDILKQSQDILGQTALHPDCEEKHRQRMIGLNNFILNLAGLESYVDERIKEKELEAKAQVEAKKQKS